MNDKSLNFLNSDESDTDSTYNCAEVKGYLNKWTNYIHGWQPRYIILKDGTLSYYRSESESNLGCRGVINLNKATIKLHEFDECRFDVALNNCVWYLRADSPQDKTHWIEVLQSYKDKQEIIDKDKSLKRHGSSVSLQSNTISISSGGSLQKTQRNLKEKINEIETYKDILFEQIETLQRYFDACADKNDNGQLLDLNDKINPIDFKGECITFKATTSGVITTLNHCLDMILLRDECWSKELEKEKEKRKTLEKLNKQYKNELEQLRNTSTIGPDLEEGPHSTLPDDEFFDAVESGLDKIEEDRQLKVKLKLLSQQSQISSNSSVSEMQKGNDLDEFVTGALAKTHHLWPEIERVCKEQLSYAREGVGESGNGWQLFANEGEMKMYKREEEINGMVVDPLKACHVVKGVTAREMCHYFFTPDFRYDWETTLEDMVILERISPDTLVFLQTHKRIWPASQRDAVFWSHMKKISDDFDPEAHDVWIVCNKSTDHSDYPPANTGKCIRIYLTVILVCQTYVANKNNENPTRDDLTCKITYCSIVNPGGWAPASVLRAVYKREYPKFLKRFTQYVIDQCKEKPIMF